MVSFGSVPDSTCCCHDVYQPDRCGVVGSITVDSPPKFTLPASIHRGIQSATAPFASKTISTLQHRSTEFAALCSVFGHLLEFAKIATTMPSTVWLTDQDLQSNFLLAAHILLSIPRYHVWDVAGPSIHSHLALREAVRLALLLFMVQATVSLAGDHEWEQNYAGRIPGLLRVSEVDWSGLEDLELWVLVLGALHERGDDREWLFVQISQRMTRQRLHWQEMMRRVKGILWVDETFSELANKLEGDWIKHADLEASLCVPRAT